MSNRKIIRRVTNEIRTVESLTRSTRVVARGIEDELDALCGAAGLQAPNFKPLIRKIDAAAEAAEDMHKELYLLIQQSGEVEQDEIDDAIGDAIDDEDDLIQPLGPGGK